MVYNLTSIYAANNTLEMVASVNTTLNGYFSGAFLLIIFFLTLVIFQRNDIKHTLLGSSVITTVAGIFFLGFGWIGANILIIPIILVFISLVLTLLTNG